MSVASAIGIVSFVGANLFALAQNNDRRLLGYSSVAQIGLVLTVAGQKDILGEHYLFVAGGVLLAPLGNSLGAGCNRRVADSGTLQVLGVAGDVLLDALGPLQLEGSGLQVDGVHGGGQHQGLGGDHARALVIGCAGHRGHRARAGGYVAQRRDLQVHVLHEFHVHHVADFHFVETAGFGPEFQRALVAFRTAQRDAEVLTVDLGDLCGQLHRLGCGKERLLGRCFLRDGSGRKQRGGQEAKDRLSHVGVLRVIWVEKFQGAFCHKVIAPERLVCTGSCVL